FDSSPCEGRGRLGGSKTVAASAAPTGCSTNENGPGSRAAFRITNHQSPITASGRKQRLHLLQRIRLDLTDAFGRHAVFVGQLLQGHLVVVVEPAAADDV